MSHLKRKQQSANAENNADQLCGNCQADQCLCFHYLESTITLLFSYFVSLFVISAWLVFVCFMFVCLFLFVWLCFVCLFDSFIELFAFDYFLFDKICRYGEAV